MVDNYVDLPSKICSPLDVIVLSLPLPPGASTSGNQVLELAELAAINANTDGLEALVTAGNLSLSSIDDKVTRAFSTATNSRPSVTNTSNLALAANSSRKYAYFYNNTGASVYIKLGAAAVVNEGIRLGPNDMYELTSDKLYTGDVFVIKSTASVINLDVVEGT